MANMLEEALGYARKGWWVFPCREKPGAPFIRNNETVIPGEKTPYVAKGLDDATLDEDQIRMWWLKWADAMIGVNAGKSGLFVVDIDRKQVNGLDTFTSWNINDSAGLHSMTPSGGMHIIFSGKGKTSANAKTGIDTRSEGGYFIAPPSTILEGKYPGEYKKFDNWNKDMGGIPDGLLDKLFPDKVSDEIYKGESRGIGTGASDKKKLSRASQTFLVSGAPAGERNTTLFKVLADFCGCGYSLNEARNSVLPKCLEIGLDKGEFETVLTHAYSKPRTSAIPTEIQEKIKEGGKNPSAKITTEEMIVLESALLACLIIDNGIIPSIMDILSYSDFQALQNRIIYKAITRLFLAGIAVDYVILCDEVGKETDKISLSDISHMISEYYAGTEYAISYANVIKDKAGIRKVENLLDNKEKYIGKGKSLIEVISTLEKDVADIALYGGAKSTNILDGRQATEMVAENTRRIVNGEVTQLKTGFISYDDIIGGIYPDELIVIGGKSGDGKSSFLLSVLNNIVLQQNKSALFFSLEMSTHETICRLVSQITGIVYKKIYRGELSESQWKQYKQAMEQIADSKIYFDDGFGMGSPEIRSKIRRFAEKGLDVIGIDQLEQMGGYVGLPEYIRYDHNCYDMKNAAKEFQTPILLNHQFKVRKAANAKQNAEPEMADLNQAGEKAANQIWGIVHKRDVNNPKKILQSKISMLKNRNGATIDFSVLFLGERMLFANPAIGQDGVTFNDNSSNGDNSTPDWAQGD